MIGRVYKIVGMEEVYIGSTFDTIHERMQNHIRLYRMWIGKKRRGCGSFVLFKRYGIENCKMELIKEYDVYDDKQLKVYESLFYHQYKTQGICVNQIEPSGLRMGIKKMYEIARGDRREYKKQNYDENRERILKQLKQKVKCDICELVMNKASLTRHKKRKHEKEQ